MSKRPVIILGAGATKACGGPLTDEILPAALNGEISDESHAVNVMDREELLWLVREFLCKCFHVPDRTPVAQDDCPSLPMVLSMLRRAVQEKKSIDSWSGDRLLKAKRAIEYAIFAVVEAALRRIPWDRKFHQDILKPLYERGSEPCVISLNYDVIVDNTMFQLSESHQNLQPPDYGVDFSTERYSDFCAGGTFGQLFKIHGSLNWLYCESCKRLDLFVSEGMRTGKALDELFHAIPFDDAYSCRGTPCRSENCPGFVSPILITPTFVKDYKNPHVRKVWKKAEQRMKKADRAVIIGYSLPTDDVDIAMLFKRGLDHLPAEKISIVEFVKGDKTKPKNRRIKIGNHPVGKRYRALFGANIDWHTTGFAGWLKEQKQSGYFPFEAH